MASTLRHFSTNITTTQKISISISKAKSKLRTEHDPDKALAIYSAASNNDSSAASRYAQDLTVRRLAKSHRFTDIESLIESRKTDPKIKQEPFLSSLIRSYGVAGMFDQAMKTYHQMDQLDNLGWEALHYRVLQEAMNGHYLCNRQITVSYAYKKDSKGERHGTPSERVLAASNPANQKSRPRTLFASVPPRLPTHANGAVIAPVPPRPFANGAVAPGPVPALHRPPPPNAAFTPMQVAGQPAWQGQPLQQGQPMPPPPVQFRPPPPNMPRPPPQAAPMFPRPPPQHMAMEAQPQVWQQPPPPQHFSGRPPMPQMLMQPRPPPNALPPPPSS